MGVNFMRSDAYISVSEGELAVRCLRIDSYDPLKVTAAALIQAIAKAKAPETHAQLVARATKELTEAQALLKAGGAKSKRFLATFRISDTESAAKGTSDQRRDHLVARIKALNGVKHHVSTSAWSLLSYHATQDIVLKALEPAIDLALDHLEVVQTNPTSAKAGVSMLKS